MKLTKPPTIEKDFHGTLIACREYLFDHEDWINSIRPQCWANNGPLWDQFYVAECSVKDWEIQYFESLGLQFEPAEAQPWSPEPKALETLKSFMKAYGWKYSNPCMEVVL